MKTIQTRLLAVCDFLRHLKTFFQTVDILFIRCGHVVFIMFYLVKVPVVSKHFLEGQKNLKKTPLGFQFSS
jgi:hypothetical protein